MAFVILTEETKKITFRSRMKLASTNRNKRIDGDHTDPNENDFDENNNPITNPNRNHNSIDEDTNFIHYRKQKPWKTDKSHNCINDDFKAEHKIGVWMFLNENMSCVQCAIKVGMAIREHMKTPLD